MREKRFRVALLALLVFAQAEAWASGDDILRARDAIVAQTNDARLLVIGEMHGTVENPALIAALAVHAAAAGPLLVALEIWGQEQVRIDAWHDSDGDADARAALLAGAFWRKPRERSDGRRSQAMLDLLDALRRLRAQGLPVSVAAYDDAGFYGADRDRNALMAMRLRELAAAHPEARMLVLTGNYHARLSAPDRLRGADGQLIAQPRVPMAAHLRDLDLVSINIRAVEGGFWACMAEHCGQQQVPVGSMPPPLGLQALDPQRDAFHYLLALPRFTASEPVSVE